MQYLVLSVIFPSPQEHSLVVVIVPLPEQSAHASSQSAYKVISLSTTTCSPGAYCLPQLSLVPQPINLNPALVGVLEEMVTLTEGKAACLPGAPLPPFALNVMQ